MEFLIFIALVFIYKAIKELNEYKTVDAKQFMESIDKLDSPLIFEHKLKPNFGPNYWYTAKVGGISLKTGLTRQLALPQSVVLMKVKPAWSY